MKCIFEYLILRAGLSSGAELQILTKELLRELAKLNPEDPRAELWSKV